MAGAEQPFPGILSFVLSLLEYRQVGCSSIPEDEPEQT